MIGALVERGRAAVAAYRASLENPSTSISNPDEWLVSLMQGELAASGVRVSNEGSLRLTAVFAAVRILSESIASLPLHVFERLRSGGKATVLDHPVTSLITAIPNEEQTPFTYKELTQGHVALWGNGYSFIERTENLRPSALLPMLPDRTRAKRENGQLIYETEVNGVTVRIPPMDIVHVQAFGTNGLMGISPVSQAREAVALGLAAEKFGAKFFGQGTTTSIALKTEHALSKEARENLRVSYTRDYAGVENSHKLLVLEQGLEPVNLTMPLDDAEFIALRKMQIAEIARLFRVPLHMLAEMDRATFSNIEQQALEFVQHTLRPWVIRWEQELTRKLFRQNELGRFFVSFNLDAILRGDSAARAAFYQAMFNIGAININEIRGHEDLNPIEGGDRHFVPLNMVPLDRAGTFEPDPFPEDDERQIRTLPSPQKRSADTRHRLARSHHPLLMAAAEKVVRREVDRVRKAAEMLSPDAPGGQDIPGFRQWLRTFYADLTESVERHFAPVYRAYGAEIQAAAAEEVGAEIGITPEMEAYITAYVTRMAQRYTYESRGKLRQLIEQDDPVKAVGDKLDQWADGKAARVAARETVNAGGEFSRETYRSAGIQRLRWITVGENCPLCRSLNGKVVGIETPFVDQGDTVDGGEKQLVTPRKVRNPPLHAGCDCLIVAEI